MAEFKGTKGKWTQEEEYCKKFKQPVININGKNIKSLATVYSGLEGKINVSSEVKANALLLISKAPEILKMLKLLVTTFKDNPNMELYEITRLSRAEKLIKEATEL